MSNIWYKINIILQGVSNPIFVGYFKVFTDAVNGIFLITEFLNSENESVNILNNDGGNSANYTFVNGYFTLEGTNINSIPYLDSTYGAVEWQLYRDENVDHLGYKNSIGDWIYPIPTNVLFTVSQIPFPPSRLSSLEISQIQSLTGNELSTVIGLTTFSKLQSILADLSSSPAKIVAVVQRTFTQLTTSQIILAVPAPYSATQAATLLEATISALSPENIKTLLGSLTSVLNSLTVNQINTVFPLFSQQTLTSLETALDSTFQTSLAPFADVLTVAGYGGYLDNLCFLAGTPILTDQGKINIEKLNPDVHTIRNKKIVCITKTRSFDEYLVCFQKDSIYKNVPSQETIVSKNHKIFYKGKMFKAKEFLRLSNGVNKIQYNGQMLYNVLMEEYDKIVVNNMICETLDPNNIISQLYYETINMDVETKRNVVVNYNRLAKEHYLKKQQKK